jgi:nitroimidazol reductase NimA-like FMN-containing flavoprotein (pyridoxamine 5'-phosphate oxidase superfamily)
VNGKAFSPGHRMCYKHPKEEKALYEKMKELVRKKDMCVLATVSENLPHCSLMAYVTDEECREIYMVTLRESTKFKNLARNPRVSLLIDTREEHPAPGRSEASALTVSGRFQRIGDPEALDAARQRLLERHPHLKELLDRPDAEIFCIRMLSMLFLKGVNNAYFAEVERERPGDRV